jgi:hypothetical protein
MSTGAKLVYFSAQGQSVSQDLRPDGAILGRAPNCHVVMSDPMVSSRHARVFCHNGTWYAQDMGSSNGTAVNEAPIGREPTPLRHMDVIRCGPMSVYFMLSAAPDQQTMSPAGTPAGAPSTEVLKAAREELARMQEALTRERQAVQDLTRERDELQGRLRTAGQELDQARKEAAELRMDLGKAERACARLIAERDRLRDAERDAREEARQADARLAERTADLDRLRQDLADRRRAHEEDQRALRALREEHKALKEARGGRS